MWLFGRVAKALCIKKHLWDAWISIIEAFKKRTILFVLKQSSFTCFLVMIVQFSGFHLFSRLLCHWSFLNIGCTLCIWFFLLPKQSLGNQTAPSVTTLWMAVTSQCKSPDYTDINKCLMDISIVTSSGPCEIQHTPSGKHIVLQPCSSVSYPPHFYPDAAVLSQASLLPYWTTATAFCPWWFLYMPTNSSHSFPQNIKHNYIAFDWIWWLMYNK